MEDYSTVTSFLVLFLIIINLIFVYSVGRSHGSNLKFNIPSMSEWFMIIIYELIIVFIGYIFVGKSIMNNTM